MFGFYKGLSTPLFGAMFENSILFVTYNFIKKQVKINENPTLKDPNPMWKYAISGGISGIIAAFILTPLELVKCNLQVQNSSVGPIFKGPFEFIVYKVKSEGLKGLWKGNISCLLREIPGNMVWFSSYEFIKSRFLQPILQIENMKDLPLRYTMFAGGIAGILYWLIPYPIDTVKSSIQTVNRFQNMKINQVFITIYKEQGIKGHYKGSLLTCTRAAFSNAILFYSYEVIYKHSKNLFNE